MRESPSRSQPSGPPDSSAARARAVGTFAALAYRNYRLLWVGTLFMSAGTWVQQVTLGWLAFELTESPFQVSVVVGLRTFPMLGAPFGGVLADLFDRRKLLLINQTYLSLLAFGFALILLFGREEIWHLYVFSFLSGAGWGVNNPLRQTLVANSVPKERLMNAIALNSTAFNSMRMIGPAVAGLLIQFFGAELNFLLQAILYGAVVLLVIPYRAEYAESREGRKEQSPMDDLREGLAYVARERIPRYAVLLSMIPMLTMMAFIQTQLPVFVAQDLANREGGLLGVMYLGMGVGGFAGSLFVARFHAIQRKGRLSILAVAGAGASVLLLSQTDVWWLAWGVLVFQQMFFIAVMTTNNAILQSVTPDYLRGRVMGIYMLDVGLQPLGGLTAGLIAANYGVSAAWAAGGAAGLALTALIAALAPEFRRLRL